jgi:regulator-associated protein of mTOR
MILFLNMTQLMKERILTKITPGTVYLLIHNNHVEVLNHNIKSLERTFKRYSHKDVLEDFESNTEKDIQVNRFENTNSNGTRMTSLSWINERNNSKLLTGCDDGSIRVWDGLIEGNGAISSKEPELRAAFYTSNKMLPKPPNKGAGLVMEWQQLNGRLLTGGSSDKIQCWDLEAQKCMGVMENQVDDCLTTMTTTWDCLSLGDVEYSPLAGGSSGIGPDIIVAGYGNGKLKVFDLRTQQQGSVNNLGSTGSLFTNGRQLETEHSSWIINTSFNHYNASRYEVSSAWIRLYCHCPRKRLTTFSNEGCFW